MTTQHTHPNSDSPTVDEGPLVEIDGLTYTFIGTDRPALQDVSLRLMPGEFVVITGPSGCGKSTLALAMGGYLFHQYEGSMKGNVRIGSQNPQETPIYDLTDIVGIVQQNPEAQFCTLRVEDEIAFGLENHRLPRDEIEARIDWGLDVVDAAHLRDRDLATLSGGEQQRIAVASILVTEPRALILDEPTSNLDPVGTTEVLAILDRIRTHTEMALIVIEHKLSALAPYEPRLIRMANGRIVTDGPFVRPILPYERTSKPKAYGAGNPGIAQSSPTLEIEGLTVTYDNKPVLTDVTFKTYPGEFIALMGDNGSGKTTLLQSAIGLVKPHLGTVVALGKDVTQRSIPDLARQIGIVFQNPNHQLFAASVWDEAVFAPKNFRCLDTRTIARTHALLERAGLAGRADDHPYRLSYGEKRRLNLISVLSYDPKLILLDEILIGQDPANATFLMDLLEDAIDQGSTVIMVNHSPEVTARYASRLIFLEEGQVTIDAPPEKAFRQLIDRGREAYCPPDKDLTFPSALTSEEPHYEAPCHV